MTASNVNRYPDWLKQMHEQSHGNADLVAHFFRRAFNLVREDGAFGLIATNTIAQGDTRSTGLRWICENGGAIYDATRRYRWPGQAAVVVSVIHVHRGTWEGKRRLDGAEVSDITAFLFHGGGHDDPARLKANMGKSFQGSIMLGMGFTFDDTDKKGVATSLAEMRWLIEAEPRNREAIFPYIGGEEVNTSPTHACHRYVINFRDYPLRRENLGRQWVDADKNQRREWLQRGIVPLDYPSPVAADWPELLAIVENRVKPQREALPQKNSINRDAARNWWRFLAYRQGLHAAIANLERVLANLASQPTSGIRILAYRHGTCRLHCGLPLRYPRRLLLPPIPPSTRSGHASSGRHLKERPPLHSLRLLRDLSPFQRGGLLIPTSKLLARRTTSSELN